MTPLPHKLPNSKSQLKRLAVQRPPKSAEQLAEFINHALKHHPEVVVAKTGEGIVGVSLQLWGGTIEFNPNLTGSGTYYINDTSGG